MCAATARQGPRGAFPHPTRHGALARRRPPPPSWRPSAVARRLVCQHRARPPGLARPWWLCPARRADTLAKAGDVASATSELVARWIAGLTTKQPIPYAAEFANTLPFGSRWRFPAVRHVYLNRHAFRQDAGGTSMRPENRATEKLEESSSRTDEVHPDEVHPDEVHPNEVQMETTAEAVVSVPAVGRPFGKPPRDLLP